MGKEGERERDLPMCVHIYIYIERERERETTHTHSTAAFLFFIHREYYSVKEESKMKCVIIKFYIATIIVFIYKRHGQNTIEMNI